MDHKLQISLLAQERAKLKPEVETCEYQSYQTLMTDMNQMMQSNDFQEGDPENFLVLEVNKMQHIGPKLQRYELVRTNLRDQMALLQECQSVLKATLQNIDRLKIKEKYLMDLSLSV